MNLRIEKVQHDKRGVRVLNYPQYLVSSKNAEGILTTQEYEVFRMLHDAQETPVSVKAIYRNLYKEGYSTNMPFLSIISVVVSNVRKKLKGVFEDSGLQIQCVKKKEAGKKGYVLRHIPDKN